MLVDEITLHLGAGRGGDGVVRWLHEKGKEFGGPSGGNGGKGGDVYARAVRDVAGLASFRTVKEFKAEPGNDGANNVKQGAEGKDIEIVIPVGSRVTNLTTGFSRELLNNGERVLLLHGGRGGLGNEHFKGSTNTRPKEFTLGEEGEEAVFLIELLLVADIGLIGLPNAGKSSLLNSLTRAHSKVGNFAFTTLEPNLGDLYGLILADIPGLIEGASEGKGLGHKFLRHIERTKALLHCISAESDDLERDYHVVRNELELYNKNILDKPEILVVTKSDTVTEEVLKEKIQSLKKVSNTVFTTSIIDDGSLRRLGDYLTQTFK